MPFFIIFFLVYFLMHALVWARTGFQLDLSFRVRLAGWVAAILLAATPFLVRMIPESWPQPLERVLWWAVYIWFGVVFYLFWLQMIAMVLDWVSRLLPFGLGLCFPRKAAQFGAVALICAAIVSYGLIMADRLEIPHYTIDSDRIARDTRIVLVSDTHLGAVTSDRWTKRLVKTVNGLHPDLVLFAGDQVNDHLHWLDSEADILRTIHAPLGVYGCMGNHELYVDMQQGLAFHRRAGVRLLRGEAVDIPEAGIQLAGIDDPGHSPGNPKDNMAQELDGLDGKLDDRSFHILMAHRPWLWLEKVAPMGFDLQVSGHTHGGQITPFNWFVRRQFPYLAGHFQEKGSHLVVCRGTGVWGPPMRVGAKPQIVVIDLVRKAS